MWYALREIAMRARVSFAAGGSMVRYSGEFGGAVYALENFISVNGSSSWGAVRRVDAIVVYYLRVLINAREVLIETSFYCSPLEEALGW